MVDTDTTVANLRDSRLQEEDDNRSQLSQTSDLWETSGVRMSALCLNVLHDINDAASQYSNTDREASTSATRKESRKKGFADFFRFSKRKSKSKKKNSDTSGFDSDDDDAIAEDKVTRKIVQHGDSAPIRSGKEEFSHKDEKALWRNTEATGGNFDISASKSATLPPNTKEDKHYSDLKKKTKLGTGTTKGTKRPMDRGNTLPPRTDRAEGKSRRFTGPLKRLEANIQKMVSNVNRKFPSSDDKVRSIGQVKSGREARRDRDDTTSRDQGGDQSFVSTKEENKARNSNLDLVDPRRAAEKNTVKAEQEKDQQLGSRKESPSARRSPAASPRVRTQGKVRDSNRSRRGRSAEVPSKKGRRIRRRTLSREWVLIKTTTIEDTTFIGPFPKKPKHCHPPSDETTLANSQPDIEADSQKTRQDTKGLLIRKELTKGVPESQNTVQNDMNNNNDSIDILPTDDSEDFAPGTVGWLEKKGPTFPPTTSEPSSPYPFVTNHETTEGSFTNLNMSTDLEAKAQSEGTNVDILSPIQALTMKEWPEKDGLSTVHTASPFYPNSTSQSNQNHPISPYSQIRNVNVVEEKDMRNPCPVPDTDPLSSVQEPEREEWPKQDELNAFQATSQFSPHPIPTIIKKHPMATESYFPAMNMVTDQNVANLLQERDIDKHSPIHALVRTDGPDNLGIELEHSILCHDERLTSATDKPRWTKRKPALRNRKESPAFVISDAADNPMSETKRGERYPKLFSGISADGEPFDCKMMKKNETTQTSRPTKPRWTKRKPATRGRRQSPSRGDGDVHNASTFEVTPERSQPFFFGDASSLGDASALGCLSPFEVTAVNNDPRQMSGQSKPRWTKRKPAVRGKRASQIEGDKTAYHHGGSRNEPGGFGEDYDFSGIGRRVPGFAEEVFIGHEPLFHDVSPMFDPVFTNVQGTDESSFPMLSRHQNEAFPLDGIHPNDKLTCGRDNSPVVGSSSLVDDPRNRFEPESFWNTQLNIKLPLVTSVGDVQVTDTPGTVTSHYTTDPAFFWNSPINDESSEFEDRNDAAFYGDVDVSDELSASDVIPDKNEPLFFWNTHVYDDPYHAPVVPSERNEPSSLHEQAELGHEQPSSDVTNDSRFVQFTEDATDGSSVPDNSTTLLFQAAKHFRTEMSDDDDQVMGLNAPLMNYIYTEKCEGDVMTTPSDQPLPSKYPIGLESMADDCATKDSIIPLSDSEYLFTLSNTSQNESIHPGSPALDHRSFPCETIARWEDRSVSSVDDSIRRDNREIDQLALVQECASLPVHESEGSRGFAERSHLSKSVQNHEVLPEGEFSDSAHEKPSDEMARESCLPREDNSNVKGLTKEDSSPTKQNDGELKAGPIADGTSSLGSRLGVNYRPRSRESLDGERAARGRGSLVDEGRTASPLLKWDSGSGQTSSPRHSASDAQLRDWSNRRLFSADDDRSSPMMYFPRRMNVDLPYSDSGYSETEAETLSPCSFRSSTSRADTMTGEEGRYDSIADDDSRFTFQITGDMRSSWFNLDRSVSEKDLPDCFSPDCALQMGVKEEATWSLETVESNSLGLAEESVFDAYLSKDNKGPVSHLGSEDISPEKLAVATIRSDDFATTSQIQSKPDFKSDSDANMNSPASPMARSEPTMVEDLSNDECVPTSQEQRKADMKCDSNAKINSFDNSLSGSEPTVVKAMISNEFAPTSQRQSKTEFKNDRDAKTNSFDNSLSASEPTTVEATRSDEFPPTSQRQSKTEFKNDDDPKINSFDNSLSGSEPTMEVAMISDEFAPTSQRQSKAEFKTDSVAKINSFDNSVSGSEPTMVEALRSDEFAPTSQRQSKTEFKNDNDPKINSLDNSLSGSEPTMEVAMISDEFAPTSQRKSKAEFKTDSVAKINSFDNSVSGSEPTMVEALRSDEFAPTSQRQSKTEFKNDNDPKINSLDNSLSGSEPTMEVAMISDEFAPTSQRQSKAEFKTDSVAKINSFDNSVSGSEPTMVEALRSDEFAPTSQRQSKTEFKNDNDAKIYSLDNSVSGSEPTMEVAMISDEFAPTSQRQSKTEFKSDSCSDANINSFNNSLSVSEPTTVEATRSDEFRPTSQRQSKTEFKNDSDAKTNSFDNSLSGSEPTTVEATRSDEFSPTSQRQSKTEFKSESDAKINLFDNSLSGSEPIMVNAMRSDDFAPTSQRPSKAEFESDSDAKLNSFDNSLSGSEPTMVVAMIGDAFAPTSQRQSKEQFKSDRDAKMSSFGSSISGSGSFPAKHEQPHSEAEAEKSFRAQDRLVREMERALEHDIETVDISVASRLRKQTFPYVFVMTTSLGLVNSEKKELDNEKALTKETGHHNDGSSVEQEAVVQDKALSDKVFFPSQQDDQMATEASNRYKRPADEVLVGFKRDNNLLVSRDIPEVEASERFKSPEKNEISEKCAVEGASKCQSDGAIAYSSVIKQNEPLRCYIVPENERTDAFGENSIKTTDHVISDLPISVVKEELGSNQELFTWYEYAELHSIFRQFSEGDELTWSDLLPSTWIWNGSRFINYMSSTANKENTIHFPDPRLCRSISCQIEQDAFALVDGAPLRRQSLLSALERLQQSCSAEKEALVQITALRSRIQESRSPAKEDLVKVKTLLKEIQKSSPLWEEAHIQAKALLGRIQASLSHENEECNALPSEIQNNSLEEQDFIERNALKSELQGGNSSEEKELVRDEMPENEIQQGRSLEPEDFIERNALKSELQGRKSSVEEDLVGDEMPMPENKVQQSRSLEQKNFIECNALKSELQGRKSSVEEDLVGDEMPMPENKVQQSRSLEQKDFIECNALKSELQGRKSSVAENLVGDEMPMPENKVQQSRSLEQKDFIECNALKSELKGRKSSVEEDLVRDEMPENKVQQSRSLEQKDFIECNALKSELQSRNSSAEKDVRDKIPVNVIQQSSSSVDEVLMDSKTWPRDGPITNDAATERSISLSILSADQEFSAAEQSSGHTDDTSAHSIIKPFSSETPVASSTIQEPSSHGGHTGETDTPSESHLRLRSRPTPGDDDDVDAAFGGVSRKQTETVRSKRPAAVCLLTSTAGLLSALLIVYLGIHMEYIDI